MLDGVSDSLVELEGPAVRRPVPLRTLGVFVVGLLVAGPVAAVVVGDRRQPEGGAVALSTITASAAAVARARTVTATTSMTTSLPGDGPDLEVRSRTSIDNEAGIGRYTFTFTGLPTAATDEVEGVFTASRMYLRLPVSARPRAGGKLWTATPVPSDVDNGASTPMRTGEELLEHLAGAEGDVEVVGREDLDGVDTTHYRVDLDLTELRERTRRSQERQEARAPEHLRPLPRADISITAAPADVWLDDEGRPVRVRTVTTMKIDGRASVTTTDGRFAYDQPVEVFEPPADQVHEVATVAEAYGLLYEQPVPLGS